MNDELKEFLRYIPEKSIEWEINNETGFVILKKPKFKNKYLVKYLLPHLKRQEFKIKLDEIGSFVWRNIDGKGSIEYIARRMAAEFGDKVEPVHDRLGQFIQSLYQNKFIILKEIHNNES
jgi:hypothetical protein